MKKKLIMLVSCLLAAIMLIPTSVFAYAAEDVAGAVPEVGCNAEIIEEELAKENFDGTQIREVELPGKNIDNAKEITKQYQLQENIALIEEELASKNTDVETELNKQIEKYEDMLVVETSVEEREKIQNLIDTTRQLTSTYQLHKNSYSDSNYSVNSFDYLTPIEFFYFDCVSAAIAGFSALGFDLSAELTTVALLGPLYINTAYVPVFKERVLASQVTYDIANGTMWGGPISVS